MNPGALHVAENTFTVECRTDGDADEQNVLNQPYTTQNNSPKSHLFTVFVNTFILIMQLLHHNLNDSKLPCVPACGPIFKKS